MFTCNFKVSSAMSSCRFEVRGVWYYREKVVNMELEGLPSSAEDEQVDHVMCMTSVWLVLGLTKIPGLSLCNPSFLFQLPGHIFDCPRCPNNRFIVH